MKTPEQVTAGLIENLARSFTALVDHLEANEYDDDLECDFPFHLSLEDISAEVAVWADTYRGAVTR